MLQRLSGILLAALSLLMVSCEHKSPGSYEDYTYFYEMPQTVEKFALWQWHGADITESWFREKWALLYIDTPDCAVHCERALQAMSGVDDVKRMFLSSGPARHDQFAGIGKRYKDTSVAQFIMAATQDAFMNGFEGDGKTPVNAHAIYVVDPEWGVVASYDPRGGDRGLVELVAALKSGEL